MAPLQKLKDEGWYLTEEGLKKVSDDGKISDIQGLIRKALDIDLREINGGGLPPDFAKSTKLDVPNGCILQIQRIQNISAPKANQESKTAPRFLLIELTDGQTSCSAIETEPLPALNINTPPGTKILLKGTIKIFQGMLVLNSHIMKNCNGVVTAMVEKWEHERTVSKYAKDFKQNHTSGNAPPPWISYGQKSQQNIQSDGTFKSLNAEKKNDEAKEKDVEFTNNRNDAIAEILKTKQKKHFGGGNRQLLDHNVKKIMDKGYSEEQAKTSLKYARNNLEKAMGNLKRREDRSSSETTSRAAFPKSQKDDRFGRKGRIEESENSKPSVNVSLFDYLEDKIKIPKVSEAAPASGSSTVYKPAVSSGRNAATEDPYPRKNYKSDDYQPSNRTANRSNHSNNVYSSQPHPSNVDNRSKFENNISASFASRQKKDDDQYPNARNFVDSRNKWSGKPGMNQRQNSQEGSSGSYSKPTNTRSQASNYTPQNSYQNAAPNATYPPKYSKNYCETSKISRIDDKNSRNDDRRNTAPYKMNQLTEATASMTMSSNKRPNSYSQPNHSQQPKSQSSSRPPSQNHPSKPGQMPNGYGYKPYKIMGFQNKETNEFALNVLKNQNFDAVPPNVLGKPTQPAEAFVPMPSNRNFVVPPPPTAATVMAPPQYIPAPPINSQTFNWAWKAHDLCFAKYWEDGRYYNAEITGVGNKTCVVQFMEYGNFEEVLISDCLPVNDVNIQTVNQYNANLIHDPNLQYYQQQQQYRLHNERPIYVTPPQRSGK